MFTYLYYKENGLNFQRYRCGDVLPSINTCCKIFNVSDQTVKAALRRLRQEEYIWVQKGRPARVIFQQDEEQNNAYISQYFSERWDTLSNSRGRVPSLIRGVLPTS